MPDSTADDGPPDAAAAAPEPATEPPPPVAAAPAPAEEQQPDVASLPPDHPLLRRAQEALHRQLAEEKLRLQEELRARKKALKDAKQKREDVGVELYGYQQHLAKLQLSLEQASEEHAATEKARSQADATVAALRSQLAEGEAAATQRQQQVESLQRELERLAGALRAIQAHNEGVASQVAAAKRATYATEGAVQALEVQKRDQDFLIDGMQQRLRRLTRQAELHAEALKVQRAETAAARQLTADALSSMEAVSFEKKQLLGQWKGSLVSMAKRDASLEALHEQLHQQDEQHASMLNEAEGYRRQLAQQQQKNDAAAEVVGRLEAQAARLAAQVEAVRHQQAQLQGSHVTLQQQLAERQSALDTATEEAAKLAAKKAALERQQAKLTQEAATVEQQALERLGEQTFAEKGAQGTLREIQALRAAIAEKEAAAEQLRGILEKLEADAAVSEAGGARLAALLAELERQVQDKAAGVAALEAEMKAGHAEVEAKTRQLEQLNRRYQRLVDGAKDVETGPLEATIANLQREIATKEAAGRDLQRRWIGLQGQLVAAQADNAELAGTVGAMRAQHAVMQQKRARLDAQLQAQQQEARALSKALAGVRAEIGRLNGLLADAAGQRSTLQEDNVALETKLAAELKALEGRWVALAASIEELRCERQEAVAAVVEAEREVLVWEQRVQLEKEMQEAVDPAYGNEELAAARKEVARLSHCAAGLARSQEALVAELERAVEKREVIGMKARVSQSKKVQEMTATQARRQADELAKALSRTQRQSAAADGRLAELGLTIEAAQEATAAAGQQCAALQQQQAAVQVEIEALGKERHKALVGTSLRQREVKRYEDALAGRYKPAAPASVTALQGDQARAAALAEEVEKALMKQEKLAAAVEGLAKAEPVAAAGLERALAHVHALAQ